MTEARPKKVVVDSWAWIEYLGGSPKGETVRDIVENKKIAAYTSSVSLAEVVSKFLRQHRDPEEAVKGIAALSHILPADAESAVAAGKIHADVHARARDFGLADAFVLAAARKLGAHVLTGDPHFKQFPETILIA